MLTLRAEGDLLERSRIRPEDEPPRSTGKLGDWYATPLEGSGAPVVLCVSSRTRLPVLVSASDIGHLTEQLVMGTREVLRGIGVAEADIEEELDHMCMVRFAASAEHALGGVEVLPLGEPDRSALLTKSLELARTATDAQSPEEATRALFKRPKLRLVK
ncbi:MAG: hypothetical protein QM765_37400 [Myxococcales bacterium]